MKKIPLLLLVTLCGLFSLQNWVSATSRYDGPTEWNLIYPTVQSSIESLVNIWAIGSDVGYSKISEYKDLVHYSGWMSADIKKNLDSWLKEQVYATIKTRLVKLYDNKYLKEYEYSELREVYYKNIFSEEMALVTVYNNFLTLEKQQLNSIQESYKNEIYGKVKDWLNELREKSKITESEYMTLIQGYHANIFSNLKDPNEVYEDFIALRKKLMLASSAIVLNSSTLASSTEGYNRYYDKIKSQIGDRLAKLSTERLESNLENTKKLERKYKKGSANRMRIQATISLIEQELQSRYEAEVDIEGLLF